MTARQVLNKYKPLTCTHCYELNSKDNAAEISALIRAAEPLAGAVRKYRGDGYSLFLMHTGDWMLQWPAKYKVEGKDRRYGKKYDCGTFDSISEALNWMEQLKRMDGDIIKYEWTEVKE